MLEGKKAAFNLIASERNKKNTKNIHKKMINQ